MRTLKAIRIPWPVERALMPINNEQSNAESYEKQPGKSNRPEMDWTKWPKIMR